MLHVVVIAQSQNWEKIFWLRISDALARVFRVSREIDFSYMEIFSNFDEIFLTDSFDL